MTENNKNKTDNDLIGKFGREKDCKEKRNLFKVALFLTGF